MEPENKQAGRSEDHRRDDEHRPDDVPRKPEEPPGRRVKPPRPFGNN